MLKLTICDDEPEFISVVREYSLRLAGELGLELDISACADAEKCVRLAEQTDILFLDIRLGRENGIDAAHRIREKGLGPAIVFMTNYLQYAVEGYSVQAYRYLLKPITYVQFRSEIGDLFREKEEQKHDCFSVTTQNGQYLIRKREILYIETVYGKKLTIHTADRDILLYGSINAWEKQIGSGFFRIHNSFLLNMSAVSAVRQDTIALKNGTELPVSKYRKKDFMNAYTHFMGFRL